MGYQRRWYKTDSQKPLETGNLSDRNAEEPKSILDLGDLGQPGLGVGRRHWYMLFSPLQTSTHVCAFCLHQLLVIISSQEDLMKSTSINTDNHCQGF